MTRHALLLVGGMYVVGVVDVVGVYVDMLVVGVYVGKLVVGVIVVGGVTVVVVGGGVVTSVK